MLVAPGANLVAMLMERAEKPAAPNPNRLPLVPLFLTAEPHRELHDRFIQYLLGLFAQVIRDHPRFSAIWPVSVQYCIFMSINAR